MVVISLTVLIIYIIHNVIKGYQLVYEGSHPKRCHLINENNIPYGYRKFTFQSQDNLKMSAIEYIPNQKPKGTIMACHYLGGSKTSIYAYIEPLLKENYTVVSFDYINHGESESRRGNKYTLEDDMKRFFQKLKTLDIKGPYGVMGFSMGATVAISALDITSEIAAVMVDSGPLIFVKEYFNHVLRSKKVKEPIRRIVFLFYYLYVIGFYKMSRRMKKRLLSMDDIPILMIHSKRDRTISYRNAEYVYQTLNANKSKLITVQRAHHMTNRTILRKEYDDYVIQFFERWLVNDDKAKNHYNSIK